MGGGKVGGESQMSSQSKNLISPEEYLEGEYHAAHRSEYFNGEVFQLAGASPRHVLIVTNIVSELRRQTRKTRRCHVFSVDLRLRVSPTGLYTYPDVEVVCGEPVFVEKRRDTLTNPTLIIEVLSESTKDYDRGEKFEHYRSLPSLAEYILVAQGKVHVEHHARQTKGGWLLTETNKREDTLALPSIESELSLAEIYDGVDALPQ